MPELSMRISWSSVFAALPSLSIVVLPDMKFLTCTYTSKVSGKRKKPVMTSSRLTKTKNGVFSSDGSINWKEYDSPHGASVKYL